MDKNIDFRNSKKDKLSGTLSIPINNFKGLVVIFAHGLGSNKQSDKYQDFKKPLLENNVGIFLFDFYGHGESDGQFEDVTINKGVDDILSAIKTVKNLGYSKIGLVGTSFGGICSIMAASKTSDLKFLGLIAPVTIPEKLPPSRSPERQQLKKPFEADLANNGHKVARNLTIPIYLIHGDNDTVVPVEHSQEFCKLAPNCQLEIIKDGDHRLRDPKHYPVVLEKITKFILKNSH